MSIEDASESRAGRQYMGHSRLQDHNSLKRNAKPARTSGNEIKNDNSSPGQLGVPRRVIKKDRS